MKPDEAGSEVWLAAGDRSQVPPKGRTALLVDRALQGDVRAFRELLQSHRAAVASTLRACGVRRASSSEDLSQRIALAAWTGLPTLRDPFAFSSWLRRIAANAARDHLRRRAVRREEELTSALDLSGPDDPHERAERLAELRLMLKALAEEDRESVSLLVARADGVPFSELAKGLGVTPEALRMRALRARKRLQMRLARLRKKEPRDGRD